jgi:6,7-dimethyl-8-ribityllumazine synthase
MSRTGIVHIAENNNISDARIAIVAGRYNSIIVDRLLEGCITTLVARGIEKPAITLARVPGAFEIPVAVKRFADTGKYDAIIAVGAVIRGETPHFEFIANECSHGLAAIALSTGIPVVFGVLTVDNYQQAADRSGDEESNKGNESANTALDMISLLRNIA